MKQLASKIASKLMERSLTISKVFIGELQRLLKQEITIVGNHRQAVEQWKQCLAGVSPTRGPVLVTALRNRSWIGVGVYTACRLLKLGYAPTILFSSREVRKHFPARGTHFDFWSGVRTIPGLSFVDLDSVDVTEAERESYLAFAEVAAPSVLAYDLHVEEADVVRGDELIQKDRLCVAARLASIGAAVEKLLDGGHRYHRLILYSGLIGESPAMLEAARRCGTRTVCLEGWGWRPGHMIYNYDSPALDYDIQGWLRRIQPWTQEKEAEVDSYCYFLDGRYQGGSKWLDSIHQVQRATIDHAVPAEVRRLISGGEKVFLAALNVIGDSSMLRRETIFEGQQEWCLALIQFFSTRPDLKLIIRAHPAEIWCAGKVQIRMGERLRDAVRGIPNICLIEANVQVNTFSLMPHVSCGLVWLSSAGVDMVVRGIPVIAAARPKYTGLGIVEEPDSREEYFRIIESWCETPPRPNADQIRAAKQYLYVVFKGFSYDAWSKNSVATGVLLSKREESRESTSFYEALISEPVES